VADDLIVTDEVLTDPLVLARLLRDIIERLGDDVDSVNSQAIINRTINIINDTGAGGGSALEVQDNGSALTVAGTLLNFVGFTLTEPTDNEITIRAGVLDSDDLFAPGYDYTYQSSTSFTADLVDVTKLFRAGRRIKFNGGGVDSFGVISIASDFNSTHANDTFVTMTMESGTVPTTISDLWFTASNTSWSAIAADPMSGAPINDITTGAINTTQWWVIVGNNGALSTSTDKGVTWTTRSCGTTNDIYTCCYDVANETFWIGGKNTAGDGCFIAYSTDGSTWNTKALDTPLQGANDYIVGLAYNTGGDFLLAVMRDVSTTNNDYLQSNSQFTTVASKIAGQTWKAQVPWAPPTCCKPNDSHQQWAYSSQSYGGNSAYYTSYADPSPTSQISFPAGNTLSFYHYFQVPSGVYAYQYGYGFIDGTITWIYGIALTDTVTFADPIRDMVYSQYADIAVCVGDNGTIGYLEFANLGTADSWTMVPNGFFPTANVTKVDYNESDHVFIAIADNGQICRSTTGIS